MCTSLFQLAEIQLLAVSHWGVHFVKKDHQNLQIVRSFPLGEINYCTAPRPTTVSLEGPQGRFSLHTPRAQQLSEMVTKFCGEYRKVGALLKIFFSAFIGVELDICGIIFLQLVG